MPSTSSTSILRNPEEIRRLSMQSFFDNLDSLCEGTVIVDCAARIVWINERYATRLGAKSAAEAIGKEIEEVIPNRFKCVDCGFEENADLVGAINILARGHRVLACGESAQSGYSVKQELTEATQAIAA